MEKIAIANQKGGVAKTTTAINLSGCLAEMGKDILLIDLDPQSNLTTGIGLKGRNNNNRATIYEVITEKSELKNAVQQAKHINQKIEGHIDIITSRITLTNAELELGGKLGRETILRDIIRDSNKELENYDYILIDCNPSLGLLTINALVAVDSVVIPIQPGIFAFEGIHDLLNTIKLVRNKFNENLNIKAVLVTQVDGRANLSKEYQDKLKNLFGNKVCQTTINVNVKLNEAQDEGVPVNLYARNSQGYKDYLAATKEVFQNE